MTTSIFAAHGVWTGSELIGANEYNPQGFFENIKLLTIAKAVFSTDDGWERVPSSMKKSIHSALEKCVIDDGYVSGPWIYKSHANGWTLWRTFNPFWICVRRDKDSIFQSCRSVGIYGSKISDMDLRKTISKDQEIMDCVVSDHGGIDVYPDRLIKGDFTSIERALAYCGIAFDEKKTRDVIDPSFWHFEGESPGSRGATKDDRDGGEVAYLKGSAAHKGV